MGQRLCMVESLFQWQRAISFNGLQNAQWVCAINSGAHANPTYAGDTVYAYTEVLEKLK